MRRRTAAFGFAPEGGRLTGDVFDVNSDNMRLFTFLDSFTPFLLGLISGILFYEGGESRFPLFASYDPCRAESDGAAIMSRILLADYRIFADYREGNLRIVCNGVYFMPGFRRMEINFIIKINIA